MYTSLVFTTDRSILTQVHCTDLTDVRQLCIQSQVHVSLTVMIPNNTRVGAYLNSQDTQYGNLQQSSVTTSRMTYSTLWAHTQTCVGHSYRKETLRRVLFFFFLFFLGGNFNGLLGSSWTVTSHQRHRIASRRLSGPGRQRVRAI